MLKNEIIAWSSFFFWNNELMWDPKKIQSITRKMRKNWLDHSKNSPSRRMVPPWISLFIKFSFFTQALDGFSIDDAFLINALSVQLAINYLLCHIVTGLTSKALSVADIIYDTPWYNLPKAEANAVQRIVQRAQKPFSLSGLGILDCSLGTYLNVKSHISYFGIGTR